MLVDVFENVISVSVSVSVIVVILLCLAPFIEKKYSFQWWRYIWLILALRLIFFFRVTHPIISKEIATTSSGLKPVAMIQKLDTKISLSDITMHSVWQDIGYFFGNINVVDVIALIWVVGIFLRLIFCFTGYYLFRKSIKELKSNEVPESISKTLEKVKDEYKINKDIKIVLCNQVKSPMLTGFFTTMVIFPILDYSEAEIDLILHHELMHLKQQDIWYKFIMFIGLSIHWFNPIMWFAFRKANNDLELECDSKVVKNQDEKYKKAYSNSLLEVINYKLKGKELGSSFLFTTNYSGDKKIMKKRLGNILDFKSKKNGTALLIIALLLIVISSGMAACNMNKVENEGVAIASKEGITPTNSNRSKDVSDKVNIKAGEASQKSQSNNSKDHDSGYYLNSTESVEFQETTWKFAKAYFSSDKDEVKKYLANGVKLRVSKQNVYNKLSRLILKWNPEKLKKDKVMNVQYEFLLKGDDSCTYLGIVLKYQKSKWVVQDYYLEK